MARHGVHSHSGEIQKSHVKVTCETQMSRLSRRHIANACTENTRA